MNLVNIAKHLLQLTPLEFFFEDSTITADEIFASQQLFEILKTFKDSYFNELYTYQSLDFYDEYDEVSNEENSADENESIDQEENIDDYDENQYLNIQNSFTLDEMESTVEWVDQHPNYKFASIKQRFRKVKYMHYITRFREYIKANGTRLEKVKKIKQFMWNEFYMKRAIQKEAIQQARELDWDNFKASNSFINLFKKEYEISSRR
ncbi:unnamed protein product [Rotaria sp. Silwood2]|nr:unnamed protein product [Rotaria sp. Silwood2]CAF4556421.1 unnamed protein product [Rotaria sp. Silwood2]